MLDSDKSVISTIPSEPSLILPELIPKFVGILKCIDPLVGRIAFTSSLPNVVFPDPLSPTTPIISPFLIFMSTLSTA